MWKLERPRAGTTRSCWCPGRWRFTRRGPFGGVFEFDIVETRAGLTILRITGAGAAEAFSDEAGGHRVQRVPPTERRGRVQTSTVTVAVFAEPGPSESGLDPRDLEWETMRSGGKGGQNVNKLETKVRLRHRPSGLVVTCESERSQKRNKDTALATMAARLRAKSSADAALKQAADRRGQVGSGQRGDKRRTIRERDGRVTDHLTGRTWRYADYVRGDW